MAAVLHGAEEDVFADAGYTGADKRPEHEDRDVCWNIAIKRSIIKALPKGLRDLAEPVERALAQVRAGLSGISCGVGHDRSKGARRCRDAKTLVFRMPSSISCWPAPTRKPPLIPMGCWMI